MSINPTAYKQALHPPTPYPQHMSDEDVSYALDKSMKHSRAARKAQETIRQKRAAQQKTQAKEQLSCQIQR